MRFREVNRCYGQFLCVSSIVSLKIQFTTGFQHIKTIFLDPGGKFLNKQVSLPSILWEKAIETQQRAKVSMCQFPCAGTTLHIPSLACGSQSPLEGCPDGMRTGQ